MKFLLVLGLICLALGTVVIAAKRYISGGNDGGPDKDGDCQDFPDERRPIGDADEQIIPYNSSVIISGPFKRRTVLWKQNISLRALEVKYLKMRLLLSRLLAPNPNSDLIGDATHL